ncbi:MAG: SAM-dependent methyltransferase [Lachnospiraceae bacterium]|nr:SAM-dependent methyltransferase [Lachnospiraceae bacterium]
MEQLRNLLYDGINDNLYQIILSNPQDRKHAEKIKIRPVLMKDKLLFQETIYAGTKVFHENFSKEELIERLIENFRFHFKQGELENKEFRGTVLVSKKGKVTVKIKRNVIQEKEIDLSHNRVKKYILEEGKPVPFLIELGVQGKDGRIIKAKYDKFKQINRYLEFIRDILPILPKERTVNIIDFGCGKSYLTFAMYYYLKVLNGYDIRVIGLDLKEDVISKCNALAEKFGYNDALKFIRGDISTFEGDYQPDMVVTLHACDTATDHALEKAVRWGAKVILSVPCCQHEVNKQITCKELEPILKYGLLKERISALLTDGIRANLLEQMGYDTQILEFIDMEHTPKNLLIRAVRREKPSKEMKVLEDGQDTPVEELLKFLHTGQTLNELFTDGTRADR